MVPSYTEFAGRTIVKKNGFAGGVFKSRLRIIYQHGEMGSMGTLLQAGSLDEFLARFQPLRLILLRDRSILKQFEKIEAEKRKLKKDYEALADR